MGRAISKIKHPFRDFNVESRAHKVIGQEIKKASPKFEKDELDLKRIKEEYAESFEESLRKDHTLDKNLKDVYVQSHDVVNKVRNNNNFLTYQTMFKEPIEAVNSNRNPSRPLPQDRVQPDEFLYGHKEPDKVPEGKSLLKDILLFISKHQSEPIKYSATAIAKEYKLDENLVAKILKYYRVFEIYVPVSPEKKTNATFAGPSKPRIARKDKWAAYLPSDLDKKEKNNP